MSRTFRFEITNPLALPEGLHERHPLVNWRTYLFAKLIEHLADLPPQSRSAVHLGRNHQARRRCVVANVPDLVNQVERPQSRRQIRAGRRYRNQHQIRDA